MSNLEILEDAAAALPHRTQAMFGGHGLFAQNGGMFAGIVDDGRIMLKFVDGPAREAFLARGGEPWNYRGKMTMHDWLVIPDELYDDAQELAAWVKKAHALAPPKAAKAPRASAKKVAKRPAAKKGAAKKSARKAPASRKKAAKGRR